MKPVLAYLIILSISLISSTSHAAQSSADVSASPELKQSQRAKILGDRAASIPQEAEYIIGYGDMLSVSIYGEGDMSAAALPGISRAGASGDAPRMSNSGVRVMTDGRISLKHVGDVEVVGFTLTELADFLKNLFSVTHADPIITTTLIQSNSLRYTVMGNVAGPGIFFLDYPMTLVQVIARSGSFTEWANKEITLVRDQLREADKGQFSGNTLEFDYDDFVSGDEIEKNVLVRPGDIIIVH